MHYRDVSLIDQFITAQADFVGMVGYKAFSPMASLYTGNVL